MAGARGVIEMLTAFTSAANKQGNAAPTPMSEGLGMLVDALGGATALTHSGNAYGGDEDMKAIRAGGTPAGTSPSSTSAKPPPATTVVPQQNPIDALNQELTAQAASFGQEAATRIPEAMVTAERLATRQDTDKITGPEAKDSINKSYADMVGPGNKVVRVLPKGKFFKSTSGNMSQMIDGNTGETILYVKDSAAPVPKQNDAKVAQAVIDSSGRKTDTAFDLNTELEKVKRLRGDDLLDHVTRTMVNIDIQLAQEIKRIRQAAAAESGYTAAQAALERNLMLDDTSGFAARFGQASAETIMARQQMTAALTAAQALERSLVGEDTRIAELTSAKRTLGTLESRRATREAQLQGKKDLKEDQNEMLRDTVTPIELANYRFVFGASGDDNQDRMTIAKRRDKDPVMKELLSVTPENVHIALMHPNPKIKAGALKLVVEYEKSSNPGIAKDALTTPTAEIIKKVLNNPDQLIALIPDEARRKEVQNQLMLAKSGKEVAEMRSNILPDLLARYVERETERNFLTDTRGWKAPAITDKTSPLAQTITKVSQTHPEGKAPIGSVVDQFIGNSINGPDGKPIPFAQKIQILVDAIGGSANAIDKHLLINNDVIDAMRMRVTNEVKNRASRAFIQGQGIKFEERIQGMEYLYSKDFRKGVVPQ